ncbi:MAG: hypothetical protein QOI37_531 [Chloroflexota bacterium]|jgi:hypothetical protein|nr:hypothetical protein [Chloroflexota bacterium]MEA2653304.1 hypothetical protein [Chloroflexota bacterium]
MMAIRVEAYTSGGLASGTLARPGTLRDALEDGGRLLLDGAAWQGLEEPAAKPAGSISIPSDDVLIAVANDDPGVPVHAAWHHIHLETGPYTVEGDLATLPGFDPGRALTRPSGEFLLLKDVRLSVRARPESGVAVGDHALVNRYTVERIRADLLLGFFFPGAAVDPIGTAGGLA